MTPERADAGAETPAAASPAARSQAIRLSFACDVCDIDVADGAGSIFCDTRRAERGRRTGRPPADADGRRLALTSAAELAGRRLAAWRVAHDACVQHGRASYRIPVEEVRSTAAFVSWWLHVAGKEWFTSTAWGPFVRRTILPQLEARR